MTCGAQAATDRTDASAGTGPPRTIRCGAAGDCAPCAGEQTRPAGATVRSSGTAVRAPRIVRACAIRACAARRTLRALAAEHARKRTTPRTAGNATRRRTLCAPPRRCAGRVAPATAEQSAECRPAPTGATRTRTARTARPEGGAEQTPCRTAVRPHLVTDRSGRHGDRRGGNAGQNHRDGSGVHGGRGGHAGDVGGAGGDGTHRQHRCRRVRGCAADRRCGGRGGWCGHGQVLLSVTSRARCGSCCCPI